MRPFDEMFQILTFGDVVLGRVQAPVIFSMAAQALLASEVRLSFSG
jgi:hypothetical protein